MRAVTLIPRPDMTPILTPVTPSSVTVFLCALRGCSPRTQRLKACSAILTEPHFKGIPPLLQSAAGSGLMTSADHPMPALRTIFHVDMDAFFVSVEELFDPTLKGKPVVVGGKRDERGVVSAASYAARKFGVHSAMPLRTAYKLCPHAIFVEGHRDRYLDCSRQVFDVLQKFSPRVEMASIDEAYLDLTGTERLLGTPLAAAHALHNA